MIHEPQSLTKSAQNSSPSPQASHHSRVLTAVYFALLLGVFLLFFGYAYPTLPFWGDDWQYLSVYGTMKPGDNGWIPDRILPLLAHAGLGVLCAYVFMPLSGLDFVDAMVYTCAFVLSASTLAVCYLLYRLSLLITRHQILALFSTSSFVIIGFCASKASFMPLFLPADLQEEGVGYTLTLTAFYIIPNLLNLALLTLLMRYQFAQILRPSEQVLPKSFDSTTRALIIGGGGVTLYLAQFSMTSSALILSSYCGVALLFATLARLQQHKSLAPLVLIKSLGFYGLVLALCVGLFLVAVWYGLHGGRGSYCGGYDFGFGISYAIKHLKSFRAGFWVLFITLTLFVVYLAFRHKELRGIIAAHILWLAILTIGYVGIVSSCGAKHYLMSGLLLSVAITACVWLALLLRFMPRLIAPAVFVVIFSFLHPFQGYDERPRDAYLQHRAYAKAWVAQMQEAEFKGLDSVVITIPRELPHQHWASWFFPAFSHTLRQFGIIRREIKVEFKPQSK
ncbi:hypothetical protein [uncultured Helicobacter sp.]|uniref:hypothetical protein n=1 Tax=uncultured Helicobacter sp. TaxID=175537 RepID=UPI00260297EA|nr:hypothetical protein [uncultured Helicobacter sp.]